MGNIAMANKIIDVNLNSNSETLNLDGLDLTNEDLLQIMPRIEMMPGLTELSLNQNKLTQIPDSIGRCSDLKILQLVQNEFANFPESITSLSGLETLNISENRLTHLPESIGNLSRLEQLAVMSNRLTRLPSSIDRLSNLTNLYLSNNRLVSLPDTLVNLMPHLTVGDLCNNPLSEETRNWLDNIRTSNNITYNMAASNTVQSVEDVLEVLYENKDELAAVTADLEASDFGNVTIKYGGRHEEEKPGKTVLKEFLGLVPIATEYEQNLYGQPVKELLASALDKNLSREKRTTVVAEMATSLGDCITPVKDFLIQVKIGQLIEKSPEGGLSKMDETIIEREAIALKARKLKNLNPNEKIEQVHGLVNTIYLEGAENHDKNTNLKIIGDRERLPSITGYPNFAFNQLNKNTELIKEFARLCCQTNENNDPITEDGKYMLDTEKVKMIKEDYFADLGFPSEEYKHREKYINQYYADMRNFLDTPEVKELVYQVSDDAQKLLDIPSQQQELKRLLAKDGPETKSDVYEKYLIERKLAIEKFLSQENNAKKGYDKFTEPINSRKSSRSESPESDHGNRRGQENSRTRNLSPRK